MEGKKFAMIAFISMLLFGYSACTLPADSSSGTANISLVATITTTEVIKSVYVSGGYLYAAAGYDGLLIYKIVNPSNLVKVTGGTYSTYVPVNDVVVKTTGGSNYAFIPLGSVNELGGMMILNVTTPSNILLPAGHLTNDLAGYNSGTIAIKDDFTRAYVADSAKGLVTYTIAPGAAGGCVAGAAAKSLDNKPASDISVSGGYAYVAAKEGGVYIVD